MNVKPRDKKKKDEPPIYKAGGELPGTETSSLPPSKGHGGGGQGPRAQGGGAVPHMCVCCRLPGFSLTCRTSDI